MRLARLMRMATYGSFLILCALPGLLAAQAGESGMAEFSGYTGLLQGDGSHATVGAGAGYMFARYGGFYVDASYSPLGSTTVRHGLGTIRQSHLYDMALIGNLRIPIKPKWEPYGIIGGGAFYNTYQTPVTAASGTTNWITASQTNFVFHTGAGVRYFVHNNWGIRPEIKVSISGRSYVGFNIGFFFQMPNYY